MWLNVLNCSLLVICICELVTSNPLISKLNDDKLIREFYGNQLSRVSNDRVVRSVENKIEAKAADDDDNDDDDKDDDKKVKKSDDNDSDDDDSKKEKKSNDNDKDDDKDDDKKEEKKADADDDSKDSKEDDKDSKEGGGSVTTEKNDKDGDDDDDDNDDDNDKKTNEKPKEKKSKKKTTKVDEKLDDNQSEEKDKDVEEKKSSSSEEDDSHSNPDTEEEGDSESESDEDDEPVALPEGDEPRVHNKLLLILASGFRHDYVNVKKLSAIPELMQIGVRSKYVRPAFPANGYPNWYTLATGLVPIKNGFIDDQMYDTKYKERFPGKGHMHKHWWNKAEPLWITALKHRLKVATYWWRGSCGVTIKKRKIEKCLPYKERVGNEEVVRQLRLIVDEFEEDKLDFALVYYEALDQVGHVFGPESHKQRVAVRRFDSVLDKLLIELRDQNATEAVNVVIASDHGMAPAGVKIELSKYLDMNDVDQLVGSDTFVMVLPEKGKEEFLYKNLRRAKIEGLNVYQRENFPKHFKFGNGKSELVLPIVLTADRGFWIEKPKTHSEDSSESEDESDDDLQTNADGSAPEANNKDKQGEEGSSKRLGVHGYDPLHVPEMNGALLAFGPDLARSRTVGSIEQGDVYALACRLLNMTCPTLDASREDVLEKFLKSDDEDDDDKDNSSHDSSEEEPNQAAAGSSGSNQSGAANNEDSDQPAKSKSRWANRYNSAMCAWFNYSHLSLVGLISLFFNRNHF